jgi:hypothetical protein
VMETVKAMEMAKPAAVARPFERQYRKTAPRLATNKRKKHKRFYRPIL